MAAPFVGAIADKWGPIKVMLVSAFLYSAGIYFMTEATTQAGMLLSASFLGGVG